MLLFSSRCMFVHWSVSYVSVSLAVCLTMTIDLPETTVSRKLPVRVRGRHIVTGSIWNWLSLWTSFCTRLKKTTVCIPMVLI